MSIARTFTMVVRDLKIGPRSPIFLWAILTPVLITFLLQVVFITLFDPMPRLGIADLGRSEITSALQQMEGIDLKLAANEDELRHLVENHDVDAGLVLRTGFDAAVRAGERPTLEFTISGESLVSNRIVLAVTAIDLVREVEAKEAPVEVVLNTIGDGDVLPISKRLVPAIVLFVLIVAGIFVPAFMLVEEREHRTLDAILVTPTKMSEVMLAKAVLGFIIAMLMSFLTLAINGALGAEPLALLVILAIAAAVCIEIGLIYATLTRDVKSLYTLMKTLNPLLIGPVIFYFFPNWPQWIAKLFPTYWFIDPLYKIAIKGATLADVRTDLAVALGIGVALLPFIFILGRRMQAKLAAE